MATSSQTPQPPASPTFENPVSDSAVGEDGEPDASGDIAIAVGAKASTRRSQLEAALKGLKDGTLSEQEAAEVMDRLMISQIDELRAELTSADTGSKLLHEAIRSAVAHLTETPTNWHQATVFFAVSSDPADAEMKKWVPLMLVLSTLMIFAQLATVIAVAVGTLTPACQTSDQCSSGYYCAVGLSDRCQYCGSHSPVIMQYGDDGKTYNNLFDYRYSGFNKTYVQEVCKNPLYVPTCRAACTDPSMLVDPIPPKYGNVPQDQWDPEFRDDYLDNTCGRMCDDMDEGYGPGGKYGMNFPEGGLRRAYDARGHWGYHVSVRVIESWCDACVHEITGNVDELTSFSLVADNVNAMGFFDWVALCFAAFVVSFTVVGELKDIELCDLAVHRAEQVLSVPYRVVILVMLNMRRWGFLTFLTLDVVLLVIYRGGDALSVCFNTIAILFMCEIDNLCYRFGLGERVHARVEDKGRIELDEAEATGMALSKIAHISMIVTSILFAVAMAGGSSDAYARGETGEQDSQISTGIASTIIIYWVGGVFEAFIGFNKETGHRTWARFGLAGEIAWVSAMRIVCLIPMAGLAGWAMWGAGGKWQQAVSEDEEATIAYWAENGY